MAFVCTNVLCIELVVLVIVVAMVTLTRSATLSESFKKSPCQLSDRQTEVYDTCLRMIYGNRQLSSAEISSDMHYRRIVPCAWSKFGIFGARGFEMDAMKKMINEMPIDAELSNKLIESSVMCSTKDGSYNIMTCTADEMKQICHLDQ